MTNQKEEKGESNSKKILLLLLIFFWPAGLIYYFVKKTEIKKTKESSWFLNHPFYSWLIVMMVLGFLIILLPSEEKSPIEEVEEPEEEFLSESLQELYFKYYESDLTELQKEHLWKTEYKDKQVRWEAYVKNIEKRGLLTENDLMGTMSRGFGKNQVGVKFKDNELSKLISYPIGSLIKFEGRLVSEGTIIGSKIFYVREAVIVE